MRHEHIDAEAPPNVSVLTGTGDGSGRRRALRKVLAGGVWVHTSDQVARTAAAVVNVATEVATRHRRGPDEVVLDVVAFKRDGILLLIDRRLAMPDSMRRLERRFQLESIDAATTVLHLDSGLVRCMSVSASDRSFEAAAGEFALVAISHRLGDDGIGEPDDETTLSLLGITSDLAVQPLTPARAERIIDELGHCMLRTARYGDADDIARACRALLPI